MKTEVWIDFNDIDAGGRASTLARWARGPLAIGRRVTCSDGDGTRCEAVVTNIEGEAVSLMVLGCVDEWWTAEDARRAREQDGIKDDGDEAEAPSPPAALSASLTETDSSASLLSCGYCGAVSEQPCRKDCSGRYRR